MALHSKQQQQHTQLPQQQQPGSFDSGTASGSQASDGSSSSQGDINQKKPAKTPELSGCE
jgi:hypothetical protein